MMEKAYAQVLFDLIQKGEKPKEAVHKLHEALASRGREKLMPAIGKAFERLVQRDALKNRTVLVIARAKDEAKARLESGAKDAEIKIDQSIIGGWILYDKGTMKDESWKSALLSMYNGATRA